MSLQARIFPSASTGRLPRPVPGISGKLKRLVLVVMLSAAGLCCGFGELHAANVLRLGVAASAPSNLDPHLSAGTDAVFAEMIFNGLLRYQPGNSAVIEPDLAESLPKPKTEGGQQIWTFTLKKGVMFQPGFKQAAYEMTSEDVVYSLQKAADPMRSAYAYRYAGMSFKAQGPYTVQIILDKPLSATLFLPRFADRAGGSIICRKAAEGLNAQEFQRLPVGTGPFAFKACSAEGVITLQAHKAYFRGEPLLDGVEVVYLPDFSTCEQAFQRGELQMMCGQRSSRWVNKAARWDKTKVDEYGPAESLYLVFNTTDLPLSDKRVRKAIAYALNRREFVDLFGSPVAERLYAPVPSDMTGGVSEEDVKALGLDYDTDLVHGRRLLDQAGAAAELDLQIERPEQDTNRYLYEVLGRQLKSIGIDLMVAGQKTAASGQDVRPRDQALEFRWALAESADELLTGLLADENTYVPAQDMGLVPGYRKVDVLIAAARRETGLNKQQEIWKHAQIKLLEDMAVYPICTITYVVARQTSVDYGYTLSKCRTLVPPITEKTRLLQ
ncbi:MAG: ABC transporter substrate-binding protein [Syntrophaceae bacterium]